MNLDDAGDALGPLVVTCSDWTDDKFELWRRMVANDCADIDAVRAASAQWVRAATSTFVPPYGEWLSLYRQIRDRTTRTQRAIGRGEEIGLAEHIRRLHLRSAAGDRDAIAELGRWQTYADKHPAPIGAGDTFGDGWRAALKGEP